MMSTSTNRARDAQDAAARAVRAAFGEQPGREIATGWAPGRCTIVGEHVDYAGGVVLCEAIGLGVAVALRASPDGAWRAVSAGRVAERSSPQPVQDIGDRIFAASLILERSGLPSAPIEAGVSADLPEGAGLASSAAIACATIVALLRLHRIAVSRRELIELALGAERDIVGIRCGALDQRAIVEGSAGCALLLDFAAGESSRLEWPWRDVVIVACDSGEQHDVGGAEYRARREQCERALRLLGVDGCQQIRAPAVEATRLPQPLMRRVRHLVSETARSRDAADALRRADAEALGGLMNASHRSLVTDFDAGTRLVEAMVEAALGVGGVLGARMVGAGFGGAVIALSPRSKAAACAAAMATAAGRDASAPWTLEPSAGLGDLAPDAVGP